MRPLLVTLGTVVSFPVIATAQPTKQVEVLNFPNPQNVAGSVEITNLPAVQDVNVVSGPSAAFLGFSSILLIGDHGFLHMNSLCVETFGAGAFMCPTTAFAMQPRPSGVSGEGWVQGVFVPANPSADVSGAPAGLIEVVSGLAVPAAKYASCDGWRSTDPSGLILRVTATFAGFTQRDCDQLLPVACCRLP